MSNKFKNPNHRNNCHNDSATLKSAFSIADHRLCDCLEIWKSLGISSNCGISPISFVQWEVV